MKRSQLAILIILVVLALDQTLKIWIKTHMYLGDETAIFGLSWARLHFTENEGMAFGMELGGSYGKLFLTLFRIIAVLFIGYYLITLIKSKASTGLIISISLVFAGAMGNILDSIFYGVLFNDSHFEIAKMFPASGYAPLMYGHVVDMLYFPILQGTYPSWIPLLGGKYFLFFRPVFNLADSSITIGVISILLFQRNIFTKKHKTPAVLATPQTGITENENPETDNSSHIAS